MEIHVRAIVNTERYSSNYMTVYTVVSAVLFTHCWAMINPDDSCFWDVSLDNGCGVSDYPHLHVDAPF